MKFAKELDQDLVPEWRVKYVNYKAGKKHVKAVARAVARANATPRTNRLTPRDIYRRGSLQTPHVAAAERSGRAREIDSRPESDESDQVTAPMLIPKRQRSKNGEGPSMQYGSFIPTPPKELAVEQLELPGPALSQELSFLSENASPRGPPLRPPNRTGTTSVSSAYEMGNTASPPRKPTFRSIFNSSPNRLARNASMVDVPRSGDPMPLIRRLMSHSGALADYKMDVNMVPIEHVRAREREFFMWMDNELEKVETFYKLKEDEAGERLNVLRDQLHEMRNRRIEEIAHLRKDKEVIKEDEGRIIGASGLIGGERTSDADHSSSAQSKTGGQVSAWAKPVEKVFESAKGLKLRPRPGTNSRALQNMGISPNIHDGLAGRDPRRDYVRKQHDNDVPYRSAKRKLKLALKEYYRGLELLKSYALLNRTAFRKINKKYDKAVNAHPPLRYMSEKVNNAWFVQSDVLDGHLHAVEDLYARYFERGNHKVAMGKLRSSSQKPGEYSANAFRCGIFIGTGGVFGIQGLIYAASILNNHPDDVMRIRTGYLLQIYAGYFLTLYLFAFFCVNCSIWTHNKINYVFIFELDPRNHLDWRQMAEFPSFLTLLLGLFVWINFSSFGTSEMYLYYPVILIFVTVVFIFLPAPILFYRARQWFVYSHWRLLLAGLYPVEFRDFFLGDIFCSLTYVMANVELFFCLYAKHWADPPQCNSGHSRLLGFFTAIPGIWRALQCLRRYYDTRSAFPHLANFGKYSTTVLYYVLLSVYRIEETTYHLALFITFATINSFYSSVWDLAMDWSLLQPHIKPRLLRSVRGYKSPIPYYVAMILDIILRLNWVLYAKYTHDTQHSTVASFFIAFTEATRRGMWMLFRVENEHCANVVGFKASRDVPLPYKLQKDGSSGSENENENEEENEPDNVAATISPSPELARYRSHTSAAEEGGQSKLGTVRRRLPIVKALTKLLAEAHTQDFEKKRRPTGEGKDEEGRDEEGRDVDEDADEALQVQEMAGMESSDEGEEDSGDEGRGFGRGFDGGAGNEGDSGDREEGGDREDRHEMGEREDVKGIMDRHGKGGRSD